jgi:hypothetical protein
MMSWSRYGLDALAVTDGERGAELHYAASSGAPQVHDDI